jgi:ABC-2 type transport system ATP-binding protein
MAVLEVEGLSKSFRSRFRGRTVEAVKNLGFSVDEGSVVAFVGPNGAGKTTTLLTILGLLQPDAGRISLFGEPAGSREVRRRLGFQSEIFYTYPFHTARRALKFYGRLSGLSPSDLPDRIDAQLARLGLAEAADRKVSTFSKGMMQRLGIAQALLHEPELLLLDEPTTGLDPEGRKLVADIIAQEKARGHAVFLSSHILTDVERSCDHVLMIRRGEQVLSKRLHELSSATERWDVELTRDGGAAVERLATHGFVPAEDRDGVLLFHCSAEEKANLLRAVAELDLDVVRVQRRLETLEELYMKHLGGTSDG